MQHRVKENEFLACLIGDGILRAKGERAPGLHCGSPKGKRFTNSQTRGLPSQGGGRSMFKGSVGLKMSAEELNPDAAIQRFTTGKPPGSV